MNYPEGGGELSWGCTEDYGFARLIEKVQACSSGQREENLVGAICQAGNQVSKKHLEVLARSRMDELRSQEIDELCTAVTDAREEYLAILQNWLINKIPSSLDEIIISGGTANYMKPELSSLFKKFKIPTNWCQSLEKRVAKVFGEEVTKNHLSFRLADVYGFFYAFQGRSLPKLEEEEKTKTSKGSDTAAKNTKEKGDE